MLGLIATSPFIGWERPNARKKGRTAGRKANPPGSGSRGESKVTEHEHSDGAPVSRGKYAHSIIVDDRNSMFVAAQQMSMLLGGKVSINRKP